MGKKPQKPSAGSSQSPVQHISSTNLEKRKMFQKIYREFSRRMYLKYKFQFPRLKESELINKIVKEWEGLN